MSDNYESYKRVADEYFSLYKAFCDAGFNEEQAFELISTYCTSQAAQNILDFEERRKKRVNYRDMISRRYKDTQIDVDDLATITCVESIDASILMLTKLRDQMIKYGSVEDATE